MKLHLLRVSTSCLPRGGLGKLESRLGFCPGPVTTLGSAVPSLGQSGLGTHSGFPHHGLYPLSKRP